MTTQLPFPQNIPQTGAAQRRSGSSRFALVNGQLVLPDRIASGMSLVVDGSKISAILADEELPTWMEKGDPDHRIDVGGRWITPGLIDLHTHGALGHTFNEPNEQAFAAILQENARRGVTGVLATLATAPMEDLRQALEFIRLWIQSSPLPPDAPRFAQVFGAHLESPYTHPAQSGALDPASLRLPSDAEAGGPDQRVDFLEYADVLRIFVLAPELPGAIELVARLAEKGILPAAGHSMARESDVLAAIEVGLRHVTHLFSAMSTTVREGPWRKPGLLETALVNENLTVEMIADNKHLPATLMKLAYKCIGPDRLCVISDATSGAGLPEGSHFRMGQMTYEVADGVGMMFDRSAFAGSTTLLNQMIPVLTQVVGVPLPEAIRMASLNPARILGLDDRKGSLEPGKDADIAIFDPDFNAWGVLIGGKWLK